MFLCCRISPSSSWSRVVVMSSIVMRTWKHKQQQPFYSVILSWRSTVEGIMGLNQGGSLLIAPSNITKQILYSYCGRVCFLTHFGGIGIPLIWPQDSSSLNKYYGSQFCILIRLLPDYLSCCREDPEHSQVNRIMPLKLTDSCLRVR